MDYCWRECIKSLLPVCDQVVVCDGQSTDGTQEEIREWVKREPKLALCVYEWPFPRNAPDFWVNWLNYSREHLKTDYHLQLDADEILSEQSYGELLDHKQGSLHSVWCDRLNFFRDHRHLIPPGHALGHRVVRMAPQRIWLASDGPHPRGAEAVSMARHSGIKIFHYNYLRKREQYFKKERDLLQMFFNAVDQRMTDVEKTTGNWMTEIKGIEWTNSLIPYDGPHPRIIHEWLRERGYDV